jgi:hypothetical protein
VTLSAPQVIVLNGQKAVVQVGSEMPVLLPAAGGLEPRKATMFSGLVLEITPTAPEGKKETVLHVRPLFADTKEKGKRLEQDMASADITARATASQAILLRMALSRFDVSEAPRFGPVGPKAQAAPRIILRMIPLPAGEKRYVYLLLRAQPVGLTGPLH